MPGYGQFCPIAQASEVITERWTPLVLRELTLTAADGSYRIPFMPPGRYAIRASFAGFTDGEYTGFPIPLNSTTNRRS